MRVLDSGLLHSTPVDPVTLGKPHSCRPVRSALQHVKPKRRCFTTKRPERGTTIRSQSPTSIVAATIAARAEQGTPQLAQQSQAQLSNADLQRQLEASYLARSADELDVSQPEPSTADSENQTAEDYARLERSWQVEQASTSGRDASVSSILPALPHKPARRRNSRTKRRLGRLYAPVAPTLIEQQTQDMTCPDAQFCASIRQQLENEKAKRRVSR